MALIDTQRTGSELDTPGSTAPLRRVDRLGAGAGAAFVLCVLAGNSMTESVVGTDGSPAGTADDLAAQAASAVARTGLVLELVGLLLLVWFAATVAAVGWRRSGAGASPFLVAGAGALVAAVKLGMAAPYLAALATDGLPDEVRHALVEMNGAGFVLTWLPFALLVGVAGPMLLRAGLVGRVLAGSGLLIAALGVPVALLGATSPASAVPVAFLLSLLWTLVVSVRVAGHR